MERHGMEFLEYAELYPRYFQDGYDGMSPSFLCSYGNSKRN